MTTLLGMDEAEEVIIISHRLHQLSNSRIWRWNKAQRGLLEGEFVGLTFAEVELGILHVWQLLNKRLQLSHCLGIMTGL